MLLLAFLVVAVATVPLFGGRLSALADVRVRSAWTLVVALTAQVLIVSVFPHGSAGLHAAAHIASYVLAGWFIVRNRRIPGLSLIAAGGALNFIAIASNGGVMPSLPSALAAAGITGGTGFQNSAAVVSPKLVFLGDVFAVPPPLPFHNVFSAGDVLIAFGAAMALHQLCRSRLVPSAGGQFRTLLRNRDFVRVWGAQAVSNAGDWIYALAVATSLARRGGAPADFALLLVLQVAPSAVVGALGGPLVDRLSRKRLMIAADVLRAAAVASLFFVGTPSFAHLYAVAFGLGLFGALFMPSLQASLPNLVGESELVSANAVVTTTFHLAVMGGPVLGGLLVERLGADAAFGVNAMSFVVSAVLLTGIRLPERAADPSDVPPLQALKEGARYIWSSRLVRGILLVLGCVMLASAIRSPLEPLFVLQTLRRRPEVLGIVGGAWGIGMVVGSLGAPAIARRVARERVFAGGIALVGAAVLVASQQTSLSPVLLLWLVAGVGNGMGTVSYETLLQERVPDHLRGRVMAASEAMLDGSYLLGTLVAAAVGSAVGVRAAFVLSGLTFLGAAALARRKVVAGDVAAPPVEEVGAAPVADHEPASERRPVPERMAALVAAAAPPDAVPIGPEPDDFRERFERMMREVFPSLTGGER